MMTIRDNKDYMGLGFRVIVTIRDNRDYIGILIYSYYTTIAGWRVLLSYEAAELVAKPLR